MSKLHKFKNYLLASTFVKRAHEEIEALTAEQYYIQKNQFEKKLIQEIWPIAKFLKYIEEPGIRLLCRYNAGNQNYDAHIKLMNTQKDAYFVEVTRAERQQCEHLKREELYRNKVVFGGDCIKADGTKNKGNRKIISSPMAVNDDYALVQAIEQIKVAVQKKCNKRNPYPTPCLLLIDVVTERPLRLDEWFDLTNQVKSYICNDKFYKTFIVNCWSNLVVKV